MGGLRLNTDQYEVRSMTLAGKTITFRAFKDLQYCENPLDPIHNLENADAAYEWMFEGINEFHNMRFEKAENGIRFVPSVGVMPEDQIALSAPLKALFPAYVNSLGLTDENGKELSLEADGEGTFKEFVKSFVIASANKEWKERWTQKKLPWLMTAGSEIEQQDYLTIEENAVKDLDWDAFVKKITRMKTTPAFDAVDL